MKLNVPVVHDLKCTPLYFHAVDRRIKNFEVRKNDRDFQEGDVLHLREYTKLEGYTGRTCTRIVKYMLDDDQYVKDGFVIMGFE